MKFFIYLCMALLFTTSVLIAESTDQEKFKKEIYHKFEQLFEVKLGQGDQRAKDLGERARKNGGKLDLSLDELKKIMLKWDPSAEKLFAKLKSKEDQIKELKEQFERLLKKKVLEKDEQAIKIAERGEANEGQIELTVRQMRELISKWEK